MRYERTNDLAPKYCRDDKGSERRDAREVSLEQLLEGQQWSPGEEASAGSAGLLDQMARVATLDSSGGGAGLEYVHGSGVSFGANVSSEG